MYRSKHKGIRYAGSKGKCGAAIRYIQSCIEPGGIFHDAMCGACKVVQSITNCERWASDKDEPIMTLLVEIQNGWEPPSIVTEGEYREWMAKRGKVKHPMMGFVGYGCSFGARYFQGYARSKNGQVNFAASARSALLRQKPFLRGVHLGIGDYRKLGEELDQRRSRPRTIYYDPPYEGTKIVGSGNQRFDSKSFWEYVLHQSKKHTVLISEYHCPLPQAEIIWEAEIAAGIRFGTSGDGGKVGSGKKKVERLYCLRPSVRKKIGLGIL